MSTFGIVYIAKNQHRLLQIENAEYQQLVQAGLVDHFQLLVEEKYQILLQNYEELELELLRVSLVLTVYTNPSGRDISDNRMRLDRRVLNFLSSTRMYLDQVPTALRSAARVSAPIIERFHKSRAVCFDLRLSYRVCEALRNYAQHRDLPVHEFHFGWRRDGEDTDGPVTSFTGLKLDLALLKKDSLFKPETLAELEATDNKHDLKQLLRDYMNCLGAIHVDLRKALEEDSKWALGILTLARQRAYALPEAQDNYDISVVEVNDDDIWKDRTYLPRVRFERRKELQHRSATPPDMSTMRLSSE